MITYKLDYDGSAGPEDAEAGRAWDVIKNHEGKQTLIAQRCTEFVARRIAICLAACEGVPAELLAPGVWKMHRDHIAAQHESLGKCAETMRAREVTIQLLQDRIQELEDDKDRSGAFE